MCKRKFLSTVMLLAGMCMAFAACAGKQAQTVKVGSLKGPTSIGMVKMMDDNDRATDKKYEFVNAAAADELVAKMVSGELDIALVPANVAGILYNKTNQGISVVDINTLGVLYAVSANNSINSIEDMKNATVYITGKGTTPDFVWQYLLASNNMSLEDMNVEYKSEPNEVAALLASSDDAVGILPEPYVTSLLKQNDKLSVVVDLTGEWDAVSDQNKSRLVTGVTVVRNDFLEANPEAVERFVNDHKESALFVNENIDEAAALVESYGIIGKAAIAKEAIPKCNIVCITGDEMADTLSGYLNVLYEADPTSVGGKMPEDGFYHR